MMGCFVCQGDLKPFSLFSNRDRGRPHGLRPPTPSGIRVRTRRFKSPCLMPDIEVWFSPMPPPLDAPCRHPSGLHPLGMTEGLNRTRGLSPPSRCPCLAHVNYPPPHRAGHPKKLDEGGYIPLTPRSTFIPVHRTGYSAEGFHKFERKTVT